MSLPRPAFIAQEYPMRLNDIGPDGKIRLGAILDDMQDAAALHAEALGVGMPDLLRLGVTWVLSRLELKLEYIPEADDTVRVVTWPSGQRRVFATRQFELTSVVTGKRIGVASSWWLMLKLTNLRPTLPASVVDEPFPENADRPFFFDDAGKAPDFEGGDPMTFMVGQSMIDCNDHMNNSYYAVLAQDWLAARVGFPVRIHALRINYDHALKAGAAMICSGEVDGDAFRSVGHSEDGRKAFVMTGRFRPLLD